MKNKKYLAIVSGIILLLIIFFLTIIFSSRCYDENHTFQITNFKIGGQGSLIYPKINSQTADFEKEFPSNWILDSVKFASYSEIEKILNWMDSLNNDQSQNQQLLARVLTDSLQIRYKIWFNKYNPDSLNELLNWAENMKMFSKEDKNHNMFYDVISSYWINFVANNLSKLSEDDTSLKYKFKFKYLQSRMEQYNNFLGIKPSNLEKVIINTFEGRFGYILDRFINSTSFITKIIVFVILVLLFFSFYCLFLFTRKKL